MKERDEVWDANVRKTNGYDFQNVAWIHGKF